jgi:general secretion pathway protein F
MRIRFDVVRDRAAPLVLEIEASSPAEAYLSLQQQGYTVLAHRSPSLHGHHWFKASIGSRSSFETLVFIEQLRDLLGAGLSLIEALTTLQQAAAKYKGGVLSSLTQRLRGGQRFSEALAADPNFSSLLVALVRASELTSDLPQALTRYLEHRQRVAELRHRLTSVAIYPSLLIGVGMSVLLFLLLYVMPRFARIFDGMAGQLPWSARMMVEWARWLHANGLWLGAVVAVLTVFVVIAVASPKHRAWVQLSLLQSPFLRERVRTYFLSRWYRTTSMLVSGGIPLPEALALSNGLLPPGLQPGGWATERALRDGIAPAEAHVVSGMATPIAEHLMRAGERTGDMGTVLARIAQFHDAEIARSLEQGMRALEPVVMVLIGLGVGTVVVLMYLPIFELASAIQ